MEIIMCANAHNHLFIHVKSFFWLRRHSGHELDLGKSTFVDCPYKSDQLVYPWSEHLLLISLLEIMIPLNLSVVLFGCSYHLMPLHDFFSWLSTDTHIRFL